jgi:hypothetical protein
MTEKEECPRLLEEFYPSKEKLEEEDFEESEFDEED